MASAYPAVGRIKIVSLALSVTAVLSACALVREDASVVIPDVTGIRYPRARAELLELGLEVRRKVVAHEAPANMVLRQSVRAGTLVEPGTLIRLRVSDASVVETPKEEDEEASFSDMFATVSSGVMRVETTSCESPGHGTGFLIAPNLVATVAHVVDDGLSIAISGAGDFASGRVVGLDESNELALIETDHDLNGHVFEFADGDPAVGTEIAVIGYPLRSPLSLSRGSVSGLDRVIDITDVGRISGVIQTDAPINPGNSGGPIVDVEGRVIGLADAVDPNAQGIAFAMAASVAEPQMSSWMEQPAPPDVPSCEFPIGPEDGNYQVESDVAHEHLEDLLATFQNYIDGINSGDYRLAYSQYSPALQERVPYRAFRRGNKTSYVFGMRIRSITEVDALHDEVTVTFTSVQLPKFGRDGQPCTRWTLEYTMLNSAGRWLIDRAEERGDDAVVAC